jgi:hypothetical protein
MQSTTLRGQRGLHHSLHRRGQPPCTIAAAARTGRADSGRRLLCAREGPIGGGGCLRKYAWRPACFWRPEKFRGGLGELLEGGFACFSPKQVLGVGLGFFWSCASGYLIVQVVR